MISLPLARVVRVKVAVVRSKRPVNPWTMNRSLMTLSCCIMRMMLLRLILYLVGWVCVGVTCVIILRVSLWCQCVVFPVPRRRKWLGLWCPLVRLPWLL